MKPKMKFYITGGRQMDGTWRSDLLAQPLVSEGVDRLDALANSGITVYSEEQFLESFRQWREHLKIDPSVVIPKWLENL